MKNGLIYSFITAAVFITLEPVSKLIANEVNPYAITFLRFFIAALVFAPFWITKVIKEKNTHNPKRFGNMCIFGNHIYLHKYGTASDRC